MTWGRLPLRMERMRPVIQGLGWGWEKGMPRRLRRARTSWKCWSSSMAMALSSSTRGKRSRYFSRLRAVVAALRSRWAWSTRTAGNWSKTLGSQSAGSFWCHRSMGNGDAG